MTIKRIIWFYSLCVFVIGTGFLMLLSNCKKEEDEVIEDSIVIAPISFNPSVTYGSMTDQDGNTYKTVKIGAQIWMAENLKTTKYRNGDPIPKVTDIKKWIYLSTDAYCYYHNNLKYKNIYGCIYNLNAVEDSRKIAPAGWHVATDADWTALIDYLGGETEAIDKLLEAGKTHWLNDRGATNETGFTALPGGYRGNVSVCKSGLLDYTDGFLGSEGRWWSPNYWCRVFWPDGMCRVWLYGDNGCSVRCVKD